MRHTLAWCWALAWRRARRWVEAIWGDRSIRRRALGKLTGIFAGFLPMLWLLIPGWRAGAAQFDPEGGLACAAAGLWMLLMLPALGGQAIVMPRGGLSQVCAGPVDPRGVIAWWMVRGAPAMVLVHGLLLGLVVMRFRLPGTLGADGGALVVALVGSALVGMGLTGSVAAIQHRVPAAVRTVVGVTLIAACTWVAVVTIRVALIARGGSRLPEPWASWWLGSVDATLRSGARWLAVVGRPLAEPGDGWAVVRLCACGVALVGLALVLGRDLDVAGVHQSSVQRAEALAEARRRPRGTRRPVRVRPFGRGVWALGWKALAERTARHSRLARALELCMLCGIGGACGWMVGGGTRLASEAVLVGFAAVGAAIAGAMGGRHEAGLGTEIHHRGWMLRYPVPPRRLLAITLGVPLAQGAVVLLAVLGPAFLVAPPLRPLAAVTFAAALSYCAGVRTLRAWLWLRWPPGPDPEPLGNVLHSVASLSPLAVAAIAGLSAAALGVPVLTAVVLAGVPGAVLAGAAWPLAVRALRGLELHGS